MQVNKCPKGNNFEEVIEFFPVGVNEVVTVGLDVICQCGCDETTVQSLLTLSF
jgi:hypothetical protein